VTEVNPLALAFAAQAEAYERGRPSWPNGAIAQLLERLGARTVLDLAAGTGKLTRVLAAHADEVVAVEPLDEMRGVLEERLPEVRALAGTAEAIPVADASVDAVFVAEALHWFDLPRALSEIARVLRPGGHLVVMWNASGDEDEPWVKDLHPVLMEHALKKSGATLRENMPWRDTIEADDRFGPLEDEEAPHEQLTDREGVIAMLSSFSAIGGLPDNRRAAALAAFGEVLDRHGLTEWTLHYRTLITSTQLKRSGSNGPSSTSVGSPQ
jgi:ubiquinone/menaquinone biosynthesis C-methylase UbiE